MAARRRGFILPTTLMVVALLTVMLTAAFTMVSAEFRTTDNSLAAQRAMAIAEAGLQNYLSANSNLSGVYDTVSSIAFPGGYAAIGASRLVPAVGAKNAVWVVRSYGYATDPTLTGQPQAMRVVGRLARLNPGTLYARAAWMSAAPVHIQGIFGSNPINGSDLCTGSPVDTFGLTIASGDYTSSPGSTPGNGIEPGTWTRARVADSTHIDWAKIVAGNVDYDYDVTSGSWPGSPTGYPIYYANGDVYLTSSLGTRTGVLVVTGNLRIGSNAVWRGMIIAGGTVTNDNFFGIVGVPFAIQGSLISGLNETISPGSVGTSFVYRFTGSSSQGMRWGSCYVNSAAGSMASLTPIRNGWLDTWSLY